MTPAPITASVAGTFSSSSAPVEETICFSSTSMPFSLATSEPVAMMMVFVSIVSLPTVTLPGTGDLAGAAEHRDLVLLQQEVDALGVAVDGFLLEAHHLGEVDAGLGLDAHLGEGVLRLGVEFGGVQQRLRRECSRR